MEDQTQDGPSGHASSERNNGKGNGNGNGNGNGSTEPVRSRWTPKPEQILILESIFNSGMVNPPKDETVRIRKLLEKFGAVGDANVFYWFQNRRSRSRRRQRQMQAASLAGNHHHNQPLLQPQQHHTGYHPHATASFHNNNTNNNNNNGYIHEADGSANTVSSFPVPALAPAPPPTSFGPTSYSTLGGSSSYGVMGAADDNLFSLSGQLGFPEMDQTSILCPSETSAMHYQSGYVTVIINGVATEVPRGPLDMKAVFGEDVMLLYSSGVPVPINEFGFLLQTLQHGESYYLVSRQT